MKTKILIAAFAALLLGFTSCKKDSDENVQSRLDASKTIESDSISNPGGGGTPTYESLTGDQIFITIVTYDSMGISGLDFRYITEKKYNCLNHTLLFSNEFSGQDLKVVFNAVYIPSDEYCSPGEDFASGGTAWYPVEEGSHGLEVFLDGVAYTGSFVKSGSNFTFTWPYTSGVLLTPPVIN